MSKDFQNKYVGFMLISLVAGVLLIGLVGIVVGFIVWVAMNAKDTHKVAQAQASLVQIIVIENNIT